METQPGKDFNSEQAQQEVERVNAFLEELTALSCKHMITLSADVFVELHNPDGGFKAPCGYVLNPHITCDEGQNVSLNEDHTSFNWRSCIDLPLPENDEESTAEE